MTCERSSSAASAEFRSEGAAVALAAQPVDDEVVEPRRVEDVARDDLAGPRRSSSNALPLPAEAVVERLDAVLVSHLHNDHLDAAAAELLDPRVPLACQPSDAATLRERGFGDVRPVHGGLDLCGIGAARTAGRHGTGEIGQRMGEVSGYVRRGPGGPALYVAGETIWRDEVDDALAEHQPEVVVVNAGGARFDHGDAIIMDVYDVIETAKAAARSAIVAVHIEVLNHCLLTRADLRAAVDAAGVGDHVLIPADGDALRF